MEIILILIKLTITIGILNVWIIRFNQETPWRVVNAKSLKEEFNVYGLPSWFIYLIGFLKITLAGLLIIGLWIESLNLYASGLMILLMIGAILMHVKVRDPLKKSTPAFSMIILLLTVLINSIN
tara:strand:- start:259 stop:630 length:372 start_codon:yes stop_codon:yes gene_type:complete